MVGLPVGSRSARSAGCISQPTRCGQLTNILTEALELGNQGERGVVDVGPDALSTDRDGGDEASEKSLGDGAHVCKVRLFCLVDSRLGPPVVQVPALSYIARSPTASARHAHFLSRSNRQLSSVR